MYIFTVALYRTVSLYCTSNVCVCVVCIHLYCDKMVLTTLLLGIFSAMSTNLSPQQVVKALEVLTNDETTELVFFLGVPLNVLNDIEKGRIYKIRAIQAWLDKDTGASWEKIISGLKEIKKVVLAKEVAKQHCPQSPYVATPSSDPSQPASVLTTQPATTHTQHGLSVAPASVDVNQSSHQMTPPVVVPSGPPASGPAAGELCPVATPSSPTPSTDRVSQVRDDIERFDDTFSDLMLEAQSEMCLRESVDPSFLTKFRSRLLGLSVAKKATHTKFFRESEDEFLDAKTMLKVFAILNRYVSYRNYEILQHIVKKFCEAALQQKMQEYCQSLERFEKATPIDIYLVAIPDEANEELENAFSKLVVRIDKPASECTLYDIRKLNEAIIQGSSLCSHSVYISSVADRCVEVVVSFPSSAVGWVLSAMTPAFMHTHLLSEVAVDGIQLTIIEADSDVLVSVYLHALSNDDVL